MGLPAVQWLDNPSLAMFSLVLPGLILFGPGLVYIASLQGIPEELYEAAELEGAGFVRKISWSGSGCSWRVSFRAGSRPARGARPTRCGRETLASA